MLSATQSDNACPPVAPEPDTRPLLGGGADADLARLCKALAHPARVQIMRLLASQDSCMYGNIAEQLPQARSTVSQHLKILKQAGLIRGTIDGPRVCYCIEPRALRRLQALVAAI